MQLNSSSVGQTKMTSDEAFEEIEVALDPYLRAGGFIRQRSEAHPQAFGSRYSQYESEARELRLIWDGKDGHFVLDCRPLARETKVNPWRDLIVLRYDAQPEQAGSQASSIAREFARALEGHLEQWRSE